MALATIDDVEVALGRELTDDELPRATYLLMTASDRVSAHLAWVAEPDPIPGPVVRVTADVVVASLTRPQVTAAQYEATGYGQYREATQVRVGADTSTSAGPWLTKQQERTLAPFRTGVVAVKVISDRAQAAVEEDDG